MRFYKDPDAGVSHLCLHLVQDSVLWPQGECHVPQSDRCREVLDICLLESFLLCGMITCNSLLEQAATAAYRIKREHQIPTFSFWTCLSLSSAVRSGSTSSSGSANAAAGASTFLLFAILKDTDISPNKYFRTLKAGHCQSSRNAPTAKPSVSIAFCGQSSQPQSRPGHQRWQTVNCESPAGQLQAAANAQRPSAM